MEKKSDKKTSRSKNLIRTMALAFILTSVIPILVALAMIFSISAADFKVTITKIRPFMLWILISSIAGYFIIRRIATLVSHFTHQAKIITTQDFSKRVSIEEDSEIGELAKSFNRITQDLELKIKQLEESRGLLQDVFHRIGEAMTSASGLENLLKLVLKNINIALGSTGSFIMLLDEGSKKLKVSIASPELTKPAKKNEIALGQGIIGLVAKDHKPMVVSRPKQNGQNQQTDQLEGSFTSLACVPLIYKEECIGVITVYDKKTGRFTDENLKLLSDISSQCAIAIANFRLNADIEETYLETITALAMTVEAKDAYSGGHLERVTKYSVEMGKRLDLDDGTLKTLRDGAYLHDLGKIGIRDDVLLKNKPLTKEEFEEIKKHPVIGESIIRPVHSLTGLCELIRHHQEKVDGSGYPDGLKGDEIPLTARIIAVVDVYDALTTKRPYRKTLTKEGAKKELKKMAGVKLDAKLVDIFLDLV